MTESMLTIKLSSVITPCGGNGTTFSRMSMLYRTLSSTGTTRCGPGSSVRWNLPSRSTSPTRCCRMTRTALAMKKITASAMTSATINDAMSTFFLSLRALPLRQCTVLGVHHGDGSVDFVNLDLRALLDHHVGDVRTCGPALPVNLDLAPVPVDLRHRDTAASDQLGRRRAVTGHVADSPEQCGSQQQQHEDRHGGSGQDLQPPQTGCEDRNACTGKGTDGKHD